MITEGQRFRYAGMPKATAANPSRARKDPLPIIMPIGVELPVSNDTVNAVETKLKIPTNAPYKSATECPPP
jgi:hypothetical protein